MRHNETCEFMGNESAGRKSSRNFEDSFSAGFHENPDFDENSSAPKLLHILCDSNVVIKRENCIALLILIHRYLNM